MARFHSFVRIVARSPLLPWSAVVLVAILLGAVAVAGLDPSSVRPPAAAITTLTRITVAAALPPSPADPSVVRKPLEATAPSIATQPEPEPAPDPAGEEPAPPARDKQAPPATAGPRVAILLLGLGLDPALARAADDLPEAVALAWSVYADDPQPAQAAIRRRGREIWLELPVAHVDPARFDFGPLALSPRAPDGRNLERLTDALAGRDGLAGVVAESGAFALDPGRFGPPAAALKEQGLPLLLHGGFAGALAGEAASSAAVADGSMGVTTLPGTIDRFLDDLALRAIRDGQAIGVLRAHPLTIVRLGRWAEGTAGRGLTLVPPSMLLRPVPKEVAGTEADLHPAGHGRMVQRHGD